jgi:hypothetical protein
LVAVLVFIVAVLAVTGVVPGGRPDGLPPAPLARAIPGRSLPAMTGHPRSCHVEMLIEQPELGILITLAVLMPELKGFVLRQLC